MAEYIEREALMEYADSQPGGLISNKSIQFFPAADVAPVRHGRWVLIRPGEWTATLKCSECGRHITVDPKQGDLLKDYPYCHCGAQMDGKEADSHAQD